MKHINNTVEMVGKMDNGMMLVYEGDHVKLYETAITVKRLSGTEDRLIITVPEHMREQAGAAANCRVRLTGRIHTYGRIVDGRRKLVLRVWADHIEKVENDVQDENVVRMTGWIHHTSDFRTTPLGRHISDMLLKVRDDDGRYNAVPCIAWGDTARDAQRLHAGDWISITGRLQSRKYEKQLEGGDKVTRTAYEVSIRSMEKCGAAL